MKLLYIPGKCDGLSEYLHSLSLTMQETAFLVVKVEFCGRSCLSFACSDSSREKEHKLPLEKLFCAFRSAKGLLPPNLEHHTLKKVV